MISLISNRELAKIRKADVHTLKIMTYLFDYKL